jgi:hypothetical protein
MALSPFLQLSLAAPLRVAEVNAFTIGRERDQANQILKCREERDYDIEIEEPHSKGRV